MALRHAPLLLALAASACWAATPAGNPQAAEDAKCLSQSKPTADCYQDLRATVGADRIRVRQLEAQVSHLKKVLRTRHVPSRSQQEIDRANQIADSEFADLRNIPGAFHLAGDLVMEYMRDPHYANVPLDMIVRDVNSRVQQVADAGNEQLTAETNAAKQDVANIRAEANQKLNECYDRAERVIDAAQAIVQGSASDADTAAALAIINSATPSPTTPALPPSVQCTSRTVGQGQYARTTTDCN